MKPFNPWHLLPLWQELLLPLVAAATGVWSWFKYRHAHSWPSTQGRISGAQTLRTGNSYTRPWLAKLTYTYVVQGEYYAGSYPLRARSERKAEQRIEGWKDRMVVVRYSREHPDVSTPLKSDQPGGQLGN